MAPVRLAAPGPAKQEPILLSSAWSSRKVQELANLIPVPPLHPMERGQGERKCARPALTPRSPLSIGWRGGQGERLSAYDAATIFAKLTDFRIFICIQRAAARP